MKLMELKAARELRSTDDKVRRMVQRAAKASTRPLVQAAAKVSAQPKQIGTFAAVRQINRKVNVVQVGVAFRKGFHEANDKGSSTTESVISGAKEAFVPALMAAAPTIVMLADKGGHLAAGATVKAARAMQHTRSEYVKAVISGGVAVTGATHLTMAAAKVAAKFAAPVSAAWGGYQGAKRDENVIRGFGRGALSSVDPTAAFMDRGVIERGYDRLFGKAPEVKKSASTFKRTYASGPKAGTTEIVRKA